MLLPGLALLQTSVVHDAFQYHATAVSLVLGGDYDTFEELFLYNATRSYNPFPEGSVRYLGVPLLQLPALALGHLLAWAGVPFPDPHPANGFTLPYWYSITLFSSAAGALGLGLLWRWLARRYSPAIAAAAVALVLWASALPFFLFLWHGWTSTYSLAGTVLLLLLRDRNERRGGIQVGVAGWFLVGFAGGGLSLIWPLNGLALAVPGVDLLAQLPRHWRERQILVPWLRSAGGLAAGVAVGFAPQLAGWYGATGAIISDGYTKVGDFFTWSDPNLYGLLFDFAAHGAFVWHPILAIGLLGLALVRERRLAVGLALWAGLHIYAISCWSVWWSAIGFGNRFLIALLVPAGLGLAAILQRCARRPIGRRLAVGAGIGLVFANVALLAAYRSDVIPVGIRGPNYVPAESFDLAFVVDALLYNPGPTWQALTGERWLHQTLLQHLPATSWFGYGLTAALPLLAWWIAVRLGLRRSLGTTDERFAAAAVGLVAVTCLWLACVPGPTPPHVSFLRLDAAERILTPGASATLLPEAYFRPTREVDVLSFLSYSAGLAHGQAIATVRITTDQGVYEHPLRAGIDSAEVALDGPVLESTRHGRGAATPVHEWITNAHAERYYPARAYLSRIHLEPHAVVHRIDVVHLDIGGDLVLRDVLLRE